MEALQTHKPRIGLTADRQAREPLSEVDRKVRWYVESLESLGADVVALSCADADEAPAHLDGLAGVCFSGGGDVHPDYYGLELSSLSQGIDRARDEYEIALAGACRKKGLPLLGICRGCQLLNVAFGGTLYQDIDAEAPFETHRHKHSADDPERFHVIRVAPNSVLFELAGAGEATVNSHHHQAVRRPGEGLAVVAWAEDGVVEALVGDGGRTLAVQWHPERMEPPDRWPIAHFVRMCAEGARQRSPRCRRVM